MADDAPRLPQPKLSKTPSWIMVGFIAGALFAYGVQQQVSRRTEAKPITPTTPPPTQTEPTRSGAALKDRASLSAIENIFLQYQEKAVWHNDLTEVALWNSETGKYSELFEVMRSGDYLYIRTLPHLTRAVIRHNVEPNCPLKFTEPIDVQLKRLKETSSVWLPPTTEP